MIVFKCEREGCNSTHPYSPSLSQFAYDQLPATWVSYFPGRARDMEGRIFCSIDCLKKHLGVSGPVQPTEQPQTKMRRFWLVDGETADLTEGVKWGDGHVTLNEQSVDAGRRIFGSWEGFKAAHEGCGVQWIDQEVASEAVG